MRSSATRFLDVFRIIAIIIVLIIFVAWGLIPTIFFPEWKRKYRKIFRFLLMMI